MLMRAAHRLLLACLPALLMSCGGGGDSGTSAPVSVTPSPPPVLGPITYGNDWLVPMDYGGFTLLYDCTQHIALRYEYVLGADTGNAARPTSFTLDPTLPAGCMQQTSTNSYASVVAGWDRGHLVTSNHMDANPTYILRANYMTNIIPQVSSFNQGIWSNAEDVAECYRDLAPVHVYGGIVLNDTSNDYFLISHGIPTPDKLWKAIVTTDSAGATKAIAWLIPNRTGLGSLDSYLITIAELEQEIGMRMVGIDVPTAVKMNKPVVTWPLPVGCSLE